MATVKQEIMEHAEPVAPEPPQVIDLGSSSDSDSDDETMAKRFRVSHADGVGTNQPKQEVGTVLPLGFLEPLPREISTRNTHQNSTMLMQQEPVEAAPLMELSVPGTAAAGQRESKQFWKAGDYVGEPAAESSHTRVLMDHVRVHPKFLHSNATSHKWALGALAELLDNSLDEVCSGATNVKIDMLLNQKDGSKMLQVEDDGGGMDPPKMRQCMSLGYSAKSKSANTIGQYGNGFKTSTMRLGADVIVFSRNCGKDGKSSTQTIGLLSYTFLRNTGKEDIVVPMLDYEMAGQEWIKMSRSSVDWDTNLETIVKWSPYTSESDLLQQFSTMSDQGTRIVIYNLWEDDEGELELDFDADEHDIQVRGVNRDEEKIEMAKKYPNSRHFLTYRHSLRSYASILYLRLPNGFKIHLRGKEIKHHNIVTDMMLNQEITYRPVVADGIAKDPNMIAVLKIGFVKDAKDHIDVQGFNVYHKNRLIKPFWRVWNAAGSSGRGVIGVLEANFVEPAHDKQGFERTLVLARLEARLVTYQKKYWKENCHKIGYSSKLSKRQRQPEDEDSSPESPQTLPRRFEATPSPINFHVPKSLRSGSVYKNGSVDTTPIGSTKMGDYVVNLSSLMEFTTENATAGEKRPRLHEKTNLSDGRDADIEETPSVRFKNESGSANAFLAQKSDHNETGHPPFYKTPGFVKSRTEENTGSNGAARSENITRCSRSKVDTVMCNGNGSLQDSGLSLKQMKDENAALKERLMELESMLQELQYERNKNKLLVDQLQEAERKLVETNNEQEALIEIFSEERKRRDQEDENLRKKLKDVAAVNLRLMEKLNSSQNNIKLEQ